MKNQNKGFTLIELVVVVAIIGILAGIGIATYSSANKKARDGKRKADIESIRSALEMYKADVGSYPDDLSDLTATPVYIHDIPFVPPNSSPSTYEGGYSPSTNNVLYDICITLEVGGSYCVYNP